MEVLGLADWPILACDTSGIRYQKKENNYKSIIKINPMKKLYSFFAIMMALATTSVSAQTRYLDEEFTDVNV